jgi:demethylspheroidene O-methyltransferase
LTKALVEENALRHGAVGRLGFVGGDFLAEPLPRGYDVMTFVRVLFDWNLQLVQQLLTKAFDALPVGGKLIICEELRSSEQLGREFFWKYFLLSTDSNTYRLREKDAYLQTLGAVGFRILATHTQGIACIVAERP